MQTNSAMKHPYRKSSIDTVVASDTALYTVQTSGVIQPFQLVPRLLQAARRDKNALASGTLGAKLLVLGPGPFGFFQGSATLFLTKITGGVRAGTGAGILSWYSATLASKRGTTRWFWKNTMKLPPWRTIPVGPSNAAQINIGCIFPRE